MLKAVGFFVSKLKNFFEIEVIKSQELFCSEKTEINKICARCIDNLIAF
jgi:hypothetical protein